MVNKLLACKENSILSMIEILDIQKLKDDEEDKIWFIEFYSSY